MTIWIVLGCVALVLVLLWMTPLGAKVGYDQKGLVLAVSVGPVAIPVYPRPKKKDKKPKKKDRKKKTQAPADLQEKPAKKFPLSLNSWQEFRQYLPLICEAAGELRRKMVVQQLNVQLVWAGENPAAAAIGYGVIHGVIGGLWNLIDGSFRVRNHKFVIDLDYESKEPQVSAKAVLSLRVGQAVSFGIRYGMKLAAQQRKQRNETHNSKEVNHHE